MRDNNDPEVLGRLITQYVQVHQVPITVAADAVYARLTTGGNPLAPPQEGESVCQCWSNEVSGHAAPSPGASVQAQIASQNGAPDRPGPSDWHREYMD